MKRREALLAEWWDRTQTEVRGRLARIDRGETSAPAAVVRCWRLLVGQDVAP